MSEGAGSKVATNVTGPGAEKAKPTGVSLPGNIIT